MKSLTKTELDSLITTAAQHSEQDALMLRIIFNHGLRITEALTLTKENVVDGFLVVQRGKGSRKTTQPIQPDEKAGLETLAQSDGRFFYAEYDNLASARTIFWRRLQRYGAEAGIPQFKRHAHILKHTTGRLAYEGGMGIPELQIWLGHVNGSNTLVYLQPTEEKAANAFAAAVGK